MADRLPNCTTASRAAWRIAGSELTSSAMISLSELVSSFIASRFNSAMRSVAMLAVLVMRFKTARGPVNGWGKLAAKYCCFWTWGVALGTVDVSTGNSSVTLRLIGPDDNSAKSPITTTANARTPMTTLGLTPTKKQSLWSAGFDGFHASRAGCGAVQKSVSFALPLALKLPEIMKLAPSALPSPDTLSAV